MTPELPEIVLAYAPPAPPAGGGQRRRRLRRPAWGIAPIAVDPDLWTAGPRRRRLVRAATLTGLMGVTWAGTTALPAVAPDTPDQIAAVIDETVEAERPVLDVSELGAGMAAARSGDTEVAPRPESSGGRAEAAQEDPDAWRTNVIATHGDVEIVQPSPHVQMVGFHEGGSAADDVRPAAAPDRNLGEEPVASERREDPLPSMVLPGRGRGTGSATAIDVAMDEGRKVFAPVTGTVTAANEYSLYGKVTDTIITIEPDGHPDVQLKILHVLDAQVEIGDRVEAGRTVLAEGPHKLPFSSQIDRFVTKKGRTLPHVHLEMERVG